MGEKTVDMDNMESYLMDYDVLLHKYFWDNDRDKIPYELLRKAVLVEERQNGIRETWMLSKAQDAFLTARKVYADGTVDHLGILQLTLEKFIGNFVGIEGMERLFKASYFNFEWMMHLEYDPDRHEYTKYRDHYIHQIKNMYEMLVLLDDYGFMEYCIKAYQGKNTDISNDIERSIREQIRYADGAEEELIKEIVKQFKSGQTQVKEEENEAVREEINEEVKERQQQYYYRYLFHAVAIISALIHDIGYPIAFMLRITKNLHEFLPLSDAFLRLDDAMPHLGEILQESLLYRTVDPREIAERINRKRDHGSISAVILLSQYYETGEIYHLSPIKRMAVELSALVVYNHTLRYEYMTGEKGERYRNLFCENPISYLFRLCDDMQEWGRVYFDISKRSNFLICSRCHMPATRIEEHGGDSHIYSCGCGKDFVRRTQLSYRKLTNISACDYLKIENRLESQSMVITFGYDLVTLLQLSLYSPQFAKQRADDMYGIKRMLEGQEELPKIYIDTFLTNNPIAIKVKCLERYLQKHCAREIYKSVLIENAFDFMEMGLERPKQENVKELKRRFDRLKYELGIADLHDIVKKLEMVIDEGLENIYFIWKRNLEFYAFMAFVGENVKQIRASGKLLDRKCALAFSYQLADEIADCYKIQDRPTRTLIMDYIWQRIREVSFEEFNRAKQHKGIMDYYRESSLSTTYITNTVAEYVGSDAYDDVKNAVQIERTVGAGLILKRIEGIYDFYSDYELFALMARAV